MLQKVAKSYENTRGYILVWVLITQPKIREYTWYILVWVFAYEKHMYPHY